MATKGIKRRKPRALSDLEKRWCVKLYIRGMCQGDIVTQFAAAGVRITQGTISKHIRAYLGEKDGKMVPLPPFRMEDLLNNSKEKLYVFQEEYHDDIDAYALTQVRLVHAVRELEEMVEVLDERDEILFLEKYLSILAKVPAEDRMKALQAAYDEKREKML